MNSLNYQEIINDYRTFRNNNSFEYVNSTRDSQVYQQYMALNHPQPQHNNITNANPFGSIFQNLLGQGTPVGYQMSSFYSGPNGMTVSYGGNIPNMQNNFVSLNLFDAMTQMMNQIQNINQEQNDVPLVLKQHELDKLPKLTLSELEERIQVVTDENESCPLCLEKYSDIACSILPCGHYFCYPCIYKELSEYRHVCPLCKNNVGEYEAKI